MTTLLNDSSDSWSNTGMLSDDWLSESRSIRTGRSGHVALVEFANGAHNYLDLELLAALADRLASLDADPAVRAVLLLSSGKTFCAGADFQNGGRVGGENLTDFYAQAQRVFGTTKPMVAAIQGAAVGAGLGLALSADFRVCDSGARFSANFNRLGIHPGFGLTLTLPRLVGRQQAALLFYTGRRIDGAEAHRIGLVDSLVPIGESRQAALALAQEIAASAPLAVEDTRATLHRMGAEEVSAAISRELACQTRHFKSSDFVEGVAAMAARRPPAFLRR